MRLIGRYFNWWKENRDVDGSGLIAILHPWESGIDLSPAYDPALGVPERIHPINQADIRGARATNLEASIYSPNQTHPTVQFYPRYPLSLTI